MKLRFHWRDRPDWDEDQEVSIEWAPSDQPRDLGIDEFPEIYVHGDHRHEADVLNDRLRDQIQRALERGVGSGEEEILEMAGMTNELEYSGTVEWMLVGETPEEQAWIERFVRTGRASNVGALKRRLMPSWW